MERAEFQRLRSNIPKLYAFTFFQMFLVIIPVIVPFFQSRGFNYEQIFVLQAIFGGTLIVLDAPSGYVADLFGRKNTLVIGSLISALGFMILWLGKSFYEMAAYEFVLGVGLSLQSGCDIAIFYNSLEKLRLFGSGAGYLGRRLTYSTAGEGIASLLGGFLAGYSLGWPAIAQGVVAWVPFFVAMTIYEPPGQKLPNQSHIQNFRSIGRAVFGHSKLLTFAILAFIFYGFATFVAVWSMQPYFQSRGVSLHFFGYLWAANCFLVAIVARSAHFIERRLGSITIVIAIGLLPVIGYFGMGLAGGLWGLLFMVSFPICRAFNQVIFQDAINRRIPAEMRATVNSVASLGMRGLFVVFGPMVGRALDADGPAGAMTTLGWVYVIGIFVIMIPLLTQRKHFKA